MSERPSRIAAAVLTAAVFAAAFCAVTALASGSAFQSEAPDGPATAPLATLTASATVTTSRTAPAATTDTATATPFPSTTRPAPPTPLPKATPTATSSLTFSEYLPALFHKIDLRAELTPEEYAVLCAIILYRFSDPSIEQLVIEDQTETWWLFDDPRGMGRRIAERWPDLADETIEELLSRNARRHPLADSFGLQTDVVLIAEEEMEEIFRSGGGWDEFYERYPGAQGIMGLSRVGFSPDGKWAVAYMGNQWDWLAGHGDVYLLEKVRGEWTVVDAMWLWIS